MAEVEIGGAGGEQLGGAGWREQIAVAAGPPRTASSRRNARAMGSATGAPRPSPGDMRSLMKTISASSGTSNAGRNLRPETLMSSSRTTANRPLIRVTSSHAFTWERSSRSCPCSSPSASPRQRLAHAVRQRGAVDAGDEFRPQTRQRGELPEHGLAPLRIAREIDDEGHGRRLPGGKWRRPFRGCSLGARSLAHGSTRSPAPVSQPRTHRGNAQPSSRGWSADGCPPPVGATGRPQCRRAASSRRVSARHRR